MVVVDDLSKGHREALKGGRLYVGSVADRAFLDDVFSREPIEAVIHFAAFSLVGESMQVPEQYFRNNVTAGLTLIETMLAHKVPYLVFSSTAATFGEPEYVPIDEAHPQNPTNPYGESKLIVEKMLKWCDLAHGLKFCALRYFNVAGAWHDGSIGEDRSQPPPVHPDPHRRGLPDDPPARRGGRGGERGMSGGGEAMLYPYRPAGEHRLPGLRPGCAAGPGALLGLMRDVGQLFDCEPVVLQRPDSPALLLFYPDTVFPWRDRSDRPVPPASGRPPGAVRRFHLPS